MLKATVRPSENFRICGVTGDCTSQSRRELNWKEGYIKRDEFTKIRLDGSECKLFGKGALWGGSCNLESTLWHLEGFIDKCTERVLYNYLFGIAHYI